MEPKRSLSNILLFVPGIVLIGYSAYILSHKTLSSQSFSLASLPKSIKELSGREFRRNDLSGKYVFLEFRGQDSPPLDEFLSQWSHYPKLSVILIHDDPSDNKYYSRFPNIHAVAADLIDMRAAKIGFYYLYNNLGTLIEAGQSRSGYDKAKIALMKYLQNDVFDPISLIDHSVWISDLVHQQNKKYVLLSMFSNFCASCRTGKIIDRLNTIRIKRENDVAIIGVLNSSFYSPSDLSVLISQSGIVFPIYLSPDDLSGQWHFYIQKYSKQLLDGVLFLYQNGVIIKSADASCFCDDDFFMLLESTGN